MARYATLDADGHPTGFYSSENHPTLPADAATITDEQYAALVNNPNGLALVNGAIVPHDRAPPALPSAQRAASALRTSDSVILRCYEHAVTVPAEWIAYRAALRGFVNGSSAGSSLPDRPAYPAGT